MSKLPLLVYPTQHYQNGGIEINERCETSLENLYVAGEASGGVHGRNRLMGNSLLDVVCFGRRAGQFAAMKSKDVKPGKLTLAHTDAYLKELEAAGIERKVQSPMILPDYRRDELKGTGVGIP
jgi:succinate dehydrogenase / fumarate reductase flavoprotein subunit